MNTERLLQRLCAAILFFSNTLTSTAQLSTWGTTEYYGKPWVKNTSSPLNITKGLANRHLALWASHGNYYDLREGRWRWQRPSLFCTTEDLYTQTIVVPYLIPMLENAGAYVFTPRERDWQRHELIIDNDGALSSAAGIYQEHPSDEWEKAPQTGFALRSKYYVDGENPFESGSARMVETTRRHDHQATITYQPNIPEEGRYAVYVSYQTVPGSVPDALYTVYHKGQKTEFLVNQRMGGSTWVYLGTFDFDKGSTPYNCVTLSNYSQTDGMVTADAVRFGGGMGNIERGGVTSGMPRCLEGARYYAQWAGMPYRVYSSKNGENDYSDDINARSLMLNELCGGSVYAPDSVGRHVPIELSLAIHSDAGYNKPDGKGVFGSLTICTTQHGDSLLGAGHSRQMSYDLAAELLDNTTADLQHMFGTWESRELYNRNYSETRVPIVPSAILETLSHQNFGDMLFGQDPNFRFFLARSIYKTVLRYITKRHGLPYVVAPLPPQNFHIEFTDKRDEIKMTWSPTIDSKEPTATPTSYIIYMAENTGGFDNGQVVRSNSVTMRLKPGVLYSFRIAAANEGGCSFPTEVLSACYQPDARQTVLVVGGFHRLSSPAVCQQGFNLDDDIGVTYGRTCGWLGRQQVFDINQIGIESETGLGYSSNELAGRFIGGNDFNYVRNHATSIQSAGAYNIVSCSKEAIKYMKLNQYAVIDLQLGLECNDGHSLLPYKSFPEYLQTALQQFTKQGGCLLVSGAYVASDMQATSERAFLSDILKCRYEGENRNTDEHIQGLGLLFPVYRQLNEHHYAAQRTDVIMPTHAQAFPAMLYPDGTCAAIAYQGTDYRTFIIGFPLECIQQQTEEKAIMRGILKFLLPK